jgi:uncharacterized protein YbbC (DUF1343 family)
MPQQTPVLFGIDILLTQAANYTAKRMALVCNNASLTTMGITTRAALLQKGFTLVKLFSPEHGLTAKGEDGSFQNDSIDTATGLPVISLYGNYLAPQQKDLEDIDVVVFDIPDVGCRFYTYLWTMTHVMESCAANNKELIITDRPNPITGNLLLAEGPILDEKNCSSFIGRYAIPIRHSCTLGELALYFTALKIKNLRLTVIPVQNWQRNQSPGFVFTPTSPAIQNQHTALLYPGMGLLEGININEGRGTNQPFNCCGAPWINENDLQNAFAKTNCPGISSQPITYTPDSGLYANELCKGLQFFISDATAFRPVQTGIVLIKTIIYLYTSHVTERLYPTVANPSGTGHLNKLLGIPGAFDTIKSTAACNFNIADEWAVLMKEFLLY